MMFRNYAGSDLFQSINADNRTGRLQNNVLGNASGVGTADVITRRLYDKIDHETTNINNIVSAQLEIAKTPLIMENDRDALTVCILQSLFRFVGWRVRRRFPFKYPMIVLICQRSAFVQDLTADNIADEHRMRTEINLINDFSLQHR